ncbi:hypothetical protein BDK88_4089 [Natrinema hispanicum]|uniref:Uncharacterized protein n=1 Tax=Natrinema hispanicum TaxID=392421 RepID=A0A482Y258_9EURY|nr:hypothetical protein BDK88_4089 [Natrinema hispanicum]
MPVERSFDEDEFNLPLNFSTHERCTTCAEFRDKFDQCVEFESIGMWGGPRIETKQGETIAEGHESVRMILNAVLGEESDDITSCRMYDCDSEATHTVEIEFTDPEEWFTTYYCTDCADKDNSNIQSVYENLSTKFCDYRRCYNLVHESRDYCPSHQYE